MVNEKLNIGLITLPIDSSGPVTLSKVVKILYDLNCKIYLITGNDGFKSFENDKRVELYGLQYSSGKSTLTRILKYIYLQLWLSYVILINYKNLDLCIFIFANGLILPMITAKILKKRIIEICTGSTIQVLEASNDKLVNIFSILSKLSYTISDSIVMYSSSMIKEYNLERLSNKMVINNHHFIDISKFNITKPFEERNKLIGFVGRIDAEKGCMNFVKSLKYVNPEYNVKYIIIGDGPLKEGIINYIKNNEIENQVKMLGWIENDKIPAYLNELQLLVLPSYTEGLPSILLEAMACGTPILSTQVGAVRDLIIDGNNGFVMESNSPKCIASNLMRVLNHSNNGEVIENARHLIEHDYDFEYIKEKWKGMLNIC